MQNNKTQFYGVGVGPGDSSLLTLKAVDVLCKCDIIFDAIGKNSLSSVAGGIVDDIPNCPAERVLLTFSMSLDNEERVASYAKNAKIVTEYIKQGKTCAFVTIGDPLIYSTYIYLMREVKKLLSDVIIETVPGITSYQAAAAKLNFPLVEDKEILCVIPAYDEELFENNPIVASADTLISLKTYKTKNKIIDKLYENNYSKEGIYAIKVGHKEEKFITDFEKASKEPNEYLSLIIAKKDNKNG